MDARAAIAVAAAALLALAAGCGSTAETFRIGVLSDCYGPFSFRNEAIVASAELPLLRRGAALRGPQPSSGVTPVDIAGHPVELEIGCVAGSEDVIPESRRLVEGDGAQAIVGPMSPEEGMVMRDYARTRPQTAFLIQPSGAPELTLTRPARNVFRFTTDAAQAAAGAGTYAYRTLGWRTAAVVADDAPFSWENVAGFVAEFCSLGGRIVDRTWIPLGADPAALVAHLPRADGVYLSPIYSPMGGFVKGYAAGHRDLSRRLVASAWVLNDPGVVARARGVVIAGSLPVEPTPAEARYAASFAKAFSSVPVDGTMVSYRDGVEALLEAFVRDGGATGAPLLAALTRLTLASPAGRIHLDANRQAVGPNYLSRIGTDADGKPAIRTLRVVPDVEQTFGGYFRPTGPPASRTAPACVRRRPPPWAR